MSTIGSNLITLRKDKGWTQKDLSVHSGISRATIATYETTNKKPKIEKLTKLANALDVSIRRIDGSAAELAAPCPLCSSFDDIEKGTIAMYAKLPAHKKAIIQQDIKKLSNPDGYEIEDHDTYLRVEYVGQFNFEKYERYIIAITRHEKYKKLPIVQISNFMPDEQDYILGKAGELYAKYIKDYPMMWACVVPWETDKYILGKWKQEARNICSNRRVFTRPKDAIGWVEGRLSEILLQVEDKIEMQSDTKIFKLSERLDGIFGGGAINGEDKK